jgi:Flp pilus assembly pilin Flp
MTRIANRLRLRLGKRDSGATAVEYALILVLITAGLVLVFTVIGTDVKFRLNQACVAIKACTAPV